ncbi:sigma-70 family RNA polymerase sigma factor [Micromonospora sp. B9E7]|uniref:RNA polymerase sigma factor n=1 Tax=Micromonospora sp. B9E7 TaxID=3153574 RepID=UPI00325DCAA3
MPDAQRTAADRQRLTDLFRRHGDAIHAYASDRLGGQDAQDLVAEVFIVAWRRLATIRIGEERPWLFGVARRLVMQHHRHRSDQAALESRLHSMPESREVADSGSPQAQRAEVLGALAHLTEADREVLLLRYWYDLSAKESATVLGCSAATFAVRLHRARRRFEKFYGEQSAEPQPLVGSSVPAYPRGLQ